MRSGFFPRKIICFRVLRQIAWCGLAFLFSGFLWAQSRIASGTLDPAPDASQLKQFPPSTLTEQYIWTEKETGGQAHCAKCAMGFSERFFVERGFARGDALCCGVG